MGINTKPMKPSLSLAAAMGTLALAVSAQAATVIVPVGNYSFEIEGATPDANGWAPLPQPGAWVTGVSNFQILDAGIKEGHFDAAEVPDGDNVLNLGTVGTMTQDLSEMVSVGDIVTFSFAIGNSQSGVDSPGGDATTYFRIDGSSVYSEVVTNNAADGEFLYKTVQWTADEAGILGIGFSGGNAWLDDVSVSVTAVPEPTTTALLGLGGFALILRRRK